MAYELTKLVHGEEEAEKAQSDARSLFVSGGANAPEARISVDDLTDGVIDIATLLVKTGLCASKSDARRAIDQGGVSVDGEKVTDGKMSFDEAALKNGILIKRGKKNFKKAIM